MDFKHLIFLIGVTALASVCFAEEKQPESGTEDGLNILFFGNSFTFGAGANEALNMNGVPGIVKKIAVAAGKPTPNVQKSTSGGKTLEWHLQNTAQTIEAPSQWKTIPDGFQWDYVVMQEYSTRPTTDASFNAAPEQFKADAARLYSLTAEHSPDAKVVLYETWPRHAQFKGFYPKQFENPAAFMEQLRENYKDATDRLNKEFGNDTARMAPAGDAWEKLDFDISLYGGDKYHGSNEGYLLNAMLIYRTIYGDNVSDLDLTDLLNELEISPERGHELAETADSMPI